MQDNSHCVSGRPSLHSSAVEFIPVRAGRVHLAGVARWCMSYVAVTAHIFESVTIGMQLDAVMILSVSYQNFNFYHAYPSARITVLLPTLDLSPCITATQSQPRLYLRSRTNHSVRSTDKSTDLCDILTRVMGSAFPVLCGSEAVGALACEDGPGSVHSM